MSRSVVRVLMYHNVVAEGPVDFLTVTAAQLRTQLQWLRDHGYNPISTKELLHGTLPENPIIISFDDGYLNNLINAVPILSSWSMKALFFPVAAYVDNGPIAGNLYMNASQLRSLDPALFEIGLHSFDHQSYDEMSLEEISADVERAIARFGMLSIPLQPVLAYTYGAHLKSDPFRQEQMFNLFRQHELALAFRIGNALNPLPLKHPYLVKRIDIRGTDSFSQFQQKVRKGKLPMFSKVLRYFLNA